MALDKRQMLDLIQGMAILWDNSTKSKEVTNATIQRIYMFAHLGTDTCLNKHEEWMESAEEMYKGLEKMGILKRLEKE